MLDQPMDDYEGSYGKKLESLYEAEGKELQKRGITPEKFTQSLFKAGKGVTDGDTYDTWLQRNKIDRFMQNVSQREAQEKQALLDDQERQKNLSERGDFARGVASGVDQLQATTGGGLLMSLGKLASFAGGDNVVSKYLTGKGLDVYQEQMRQASLNPTKSLLSDKEGQWINDDLKDPGDYFDAIAGTLGNLVPSMAVSLISGGVGGKIAELAGKKAVDKTVGYFVKNQAERMLNKGWGAKIAETASAEALKGGVALDAAKLVGEEAVRKAAQGAAQKYVGQRVGTILGTTALESTGAFADTVNHLREKFLAEGMTPEQALLKASDEASATFAMGTGLAAGMVEIFGGNIRLLDMVLGDAGGKTAKELVKAATHARANPGIRGKALNMMRDLMVEAVKQAPAEFGQEAAQEILSMSNIDFADPDFQMVTQDNFKRVLESGLAGAIGGVGGGFATEVGARAKSLIGAQETPETRAWDLEVQIARQRDMIARGMDKSLPRLAAALAENESELAVLQQHLGNIKAGVGVSYQDAAKRIGEELPSPDGKPFTVKALRNLVRHGNLEKSEDGTVKAESLEAFIAQKKGTAREVDPEVQKKAGDPLVVDPKEVASSKKPVGETAATAVPTMDTMKPGQTVTLFRGESSENEEGGQWWTTDRAKAEKYGAVTEVSLPAELIGKHAAQGHNGPDEFVFFTEGKRPQDLVASQTREEEPPSWLTAGPPPDDDDRFLRENTEFNVQGIGRDRMSQHLETAGLSSVSRIFESTDELDEDTRAMLSERQGENEPAFWHKGQLHVNAARVRDDDHAADLIAHEIIHPAEEAHVAELAKKIGAEEAVNEWNTTLDKVYSSFTSEIEKLAVERGYNKDYDLSTEAGRRGIAGELLADKNVKGTEKFYDKAVVVLKRIVNAVRRTFGLKEMDLGESEVRVLLSKMKKSYANQKAEGRSVSGVRFARGKIHAFEAATVDSSKTIAEQREELYYRTQALKETRTHLLDMSKKAISHIKSIGGISEDSIYDFIGESQKDQVKELKKKFGAGVITKNGKFGIDQVAASLTSAMPHLEINGETENLYTLLNESLFSQTEINRQYANSVHALDADRKRLSSLDAKAQHARELSAKTVKPKSVSMSIDQPVQKAESKSADYMDKIVESNAQSNGMSYSESNFLRGLPDNFTPQQKTLALQKYAVWLMENHSPAAMKKRWNDGIASGDIYKDDDAPGGWVVDGVAPNAGGSGGHKYALEQYFTQRYEYGKKLQHKVGPVGALSTSTKSDVPRMSMKPDVPRMSMKPDVPRMSMKFEHDGQGRVMRPELLEAGITSTIRAMWEGKRTATTRTVDQVNEMELAPGKTFYVEEDGLRMLARVDRIVPVASMSAEQWSRKEGWAPEMYAQYVRRRQERIHGLKEVNPKSRKTYELTEQQKARYGEERDSITGEMLDPKLENYVQVQFTILLKEEVRQDAGLSEEQKAALKPEPVSPVQTFEPDPDKGFEYTNEMQLEDGLEDHFLDFDKKLDDFLMSWIKQESPQWTYKTPKRIRNLDRDMAANDEERLARLRALPREKKLRLLASTAPENFHELLRSSSSLVVSTAQKMTEILMAGGLAPVYSGDLRRFMSGAWSLLTTQATARDAVYIQRAKVINAGKLDAAGKKRALKKLRDDRADLFKEFVDKVVEAVQQVVDATVGFDSQARTALEAAHGAQWKAFIGSLEENMRNMREFAKNYRFLRKSMFMGMRPYYGAHMAKLPDRLARIEYLARSVTDRIPFTHYDSVQSYIDGVAGMVRNNLNFRPGLCSLSAGAKELYVKMISQLMAISSYTGKVSAKNRAKFDAALLGMVNDDLSNSSKGILSQEQAREFLRAMETVHENREGMTESQWAAIEGQYRLAELLRSTDVVAAAWAGRVKKLPAFESVADFVSQVQNMHDQALERMVDMGLITRDEAYTVLAFPVTGYAGNKLSTDKFSNEATPADAFGRNQLRSLLSGLNRAYGGKIRVRQNALWPAFSMMFNEKGQQVHELKHMRTRVEEFLKKEGDVFGMTVDDIMLGLIGIGQEYAAGGHKFLVVENLPKVLGDKLVKAGFIDVDVASSGYKPLAKFDQKSIAAKIARYVRTRGEVRDDFDPVMRSLFGEMEYKQNPRMAAFHDIHPHTSLNMVPRDGKYTDLRSVRPGAMLYDAQSGEVFLVGGYAGYVQEVGKPISDTAQYSLVAFTPHQSGTGLAVGTKLNDQDQPVMMTLAEIEKRQLHVVPRIWELLAGYVDEKGGMQIDQAFEIGNAMRVLGEQKKIADISMESRNFDLRSAAYAGHVIDRNGHLHVVTFDHNSQPMIYTVSDNPGLVNFDRGVIVEQVAQTITGDEKFLRLARAMDNAEGFGDRRLAAYNKLLKHVDAMIPQIMDHLLLNDEEADVVTSILKSAITDRFHEAGDRTNVGELMGGELLIEDEDYLAPAREGDEDSLEDRQSDPGISKAQNVSLVQEHNDQLVESILFPEPDVVSTEAVAAGLESRLGALENAKAAYRQSRHDLEALEAERDRLESRLQKFKDTLSVRSAVMINSRLDALYSDLIPGAEADVEEARKNLVWVARALKTTNESAEILSKLGVDGFLTTEGQEMSAAVVRLQAEVLARVTGFSLDPEMMNTKPYGYFGTLPSSSRYTVSAIAETVLSQRGEAKEPLTIAYLLNNGHENLAAYLLSALSASREPLETDKGAITSDMARIAYALVARNMPLPVAGEQYKPLSQLSERDREVANNVFLLAPVLVAYQEEYKRVGKWSAETMWGTPAAEKNMRGKNKTLIMQMMERSGLSRILSLTDKSLNALADGKLRIITDELDLLELVSLVATQTHPVDLGIAMTGASAEDRLDFLENVEAKDVTKRSSEFADQITLQEMDFKRQLAQTLVDYVLEVWPREAGWMRDIALKLDKRAAEYRETEGRVSASESLLADLMDLLKEQGLDPERQLVMLAEVKLGLDPDKNFMVRSIDDIRSFRTADGLTQYNLITENERMMNSEEYPPLPEMTISGADYALLSMVNEIAPGTYDLSKINLATNTGRSKTLTIEEKEGGVDFGEKTLTDFGWAIVNTIRRTHEDVIANPATARPVLRNIIRSIMKWSAAAELYGENDIERIVGKYRRRSRGTANVLKTEEEPSLMRLTAFADDILSELNVLSGMNIPVIFHANGVTAEALVNGENMDRTILPQDLLHLVEEAGRGGARGMRASDALKNIMGYRDIHGRIHVFVGAHATANGTFDWQELARTIYHESVGHIGLRQVLGAEYDRFMVSVFKRQFGERKAEGMNVDMMVHHAEEFMAGMAEQVVLDEAAGRPVNKNLGTALDRIAAMLARAFRKLMLKLGFNFGVTGFEMRDTLAKAFAGSRVAGRSGLSMIISPSLIPAENLTHPGEFGQYKFNIMDTLLSKFFDYQRRWELLSRASVNAGQDLSGEYNIMHALRTQKSRIGGLSLAVDKHVDEFMGMFSGKNFSLADVAEIGQALHSLEWNLDDIRSRMFGATEEKFRNGELTQEQYDAAIARIEQQFARTKQYMRDGRYRYSRRRQPVSGMRSTEIAQILDRHIALGNLVENADGTWSGPAMAPVMKLVEMNRMALNLAEEGQMIRPGMAEAYGQAFKYYVPIPGHPAFDRGSSEYYALSGSNRFKAPGEDFVGVPADVAERDVVGLTIAGLRARAHEININRTNSVIYNFASRMNKGNPDLFHVYMTQEELLALKAQFPHMDEQAFLDYMADNGIKNMPEIPAGATRQQLKEFEENMGLIPVYRNGELRYLKIVDEGLKKGFDILNNPKQAGRVMRILGTINRWLIKANTSLNPEFFIPNMVKDISAALNTLSIRSNVAGMDGRAFAKEVLKNVPGAMKVLYANNFNKDKTGFTEEQRALDALIADFEKYGAKIQWAFMETPEEIVRNLDAAIRIKQGKGSFKEKAAAFTNSVEDFMRRSSDVFENATRLSVFAAAVRAGATKEDAALMAREITVDFDRKGEWGQALNTLYMFANAGMQGSMTIFRTMKNNPGRAAKHVAAIVGMSFSVALMNMFMGGDDDDGEPIYFNVSDETRNANLILMIPGMEQGVRIPLPYGYAFFWSIGQELVSTMFGRKSTLAAGGGILGALLNNFNPLESAASLGESHGWVRMLAPTVFDPLVDIGFEKTPFGTPLMPEKDYEDQPDSARYWRSVSTPSKIVTQWVNEIGGSGAMPGYISMSPETLDLVVESVFGGTGKFLKRVSDLALSPFSSSEVTSNDIPVGRRFAATPGQWEDREKFQSAYQEIHGVSRTMKTLQENIGMAKTPELRSQSIKDANDFRAGNQDLLSLRVTVNNIYKQTKGIDKQKERLYKSGLSESEIQPKLRELNERQRQIYQQFNKRYYQTVDAR